MNGRYDVKKETVLDRKTGLMWSRDASLSGFPMAWAEAFGFVQTLNRQRYEQYSNWRLPNRKELFSLISHKRINPCLPENHPFENVFHGYYWSASTSARLPQQAWYVHLGGARVYRGMKYASYMVWPVRSIDGKAVNVSFTGQQRCYDDQGNEIPAVVNSLQHVAIQSGIEWPKPRFDGMENTVIDRLSGLFWTRNSSYEHIAVNWKEAWDIIEKMNMKKVFGFDDWRIPHIRELESLIDLNMHSPALPENHPFGNVGNFYWSGTTSSYETRYAWALYLQDGAIGVGFKANPEFFLWPVRGNSNLLFQSI